MPGEITVQLCQVSATTTEATMGEHRVTIDRPVEKGGSAKGPMGGELFLASVGGCFMSNLLAAIRARELSISGVRAEVAGRIADSPARFESIDVRVSAETGDVEELRHAVAIADRGCIMMSTLRGKLEVRIHIAPL
jgi:putative redox protein